jgi:hypothetical protein
MRRVQRSKSRTIALLGMNLALWVAAGFVIPRFFHGNSSGSPANRQANFEAAFRSVTELGNDAPGYVPTPYGQSMYGISQAVYDSWRHEHQQPLQRIDTISLDEVRAIYQKYWNGGDCDRYAAPLDMACLDSVIGFGVEQGKDFLTQLPSNPQAAALEVARRREEFRYDTAGSYAYVRGGQQVLMEGIRRDRALASLVESYSPSQQSEFSFDLRRWLGLEKPEATESAPAASDRPESLSSSQATKPLSSEEIYTQAKPFTVEVWIKTSGIPAPATGLILTSDGLILTNQHVVNHSDFDFVRLADGRDFSGTIVDMNPDLDLALIQLEGARGLPLADFAKTSSHLKLGDTVYAIGSPTGEHWKMTTAQIIQVQSECGLMSVRCIRTPQGFLKPGNSGGPLLDSFGQVIGVNRAIQQRTGEGVSIPVEVINQYVERVREARG